MHCWFVDYNFVTRVKHSSVGVCAFTTKFWAKMPTAMKLITNIIITLVSLNTNIHNVVKFLVINRTNMAAMQTFEQYQSHAV
jgi:hypothetical protein